MARNLPQPLSRILAVSKEKKRDRREDQGIRPILKAISRLHFQGISTLLRFLPSRHHRRCYHRFRWLELMNPISAPIQSLSNSNMTYQY